MKFYGKGDAPPVFQEQGLTFIYIKRNALLLVATTKSNVSPSEVLELLNRIAKIFKDYCGILTEGSIRKNFILIYELLDEMLDFGYAQTTSTELLKSNIFNEPMAVTSSISAEIMKSNIFSRTKPSDASNIPLAIGSNRSSNNKNEIYVDIIERLT